MNFQEILATRIKHPGSVRVTVAGDWAPLPYYQPLMRSDPAAVYGELLPVLKAGDLNIVNVECVLGNAGAPIPKGGPCLRADADYVSSLTTVPFHVATLANNHSMDYGPESLEETLSVLRSAGLQCLGAGKTGDEASEPLILERGGLRIGILNCAEGEACASIDNGPGASRLDVPARILQIRDLRSRADAVMIIVHGGREHTPAPPPYFVEALRQFADAGADAVIGHHAHVPQGIEIYHGVPIVYSGGNFIFQPSSDLHYTTVGYLAHLDFSPEGLNGFYITPYKMAPGGLELLKGEALLEFTTELNVVSRLLEDPAAIRQVWDAFGDVVGSANLTGSIQSVLSSFAESPRLAAAKLHNHFFAPAHREYALHNLKRIVNGTFGDSPEWAQRLVRRWMQRKIGEPAEALGEKPSARHP